MSAMDTEPKTYGGNAGIDPLADLKTTMGLAGGRRRRRKSSKKKSKKAKRSKRTKSRRSRR